MSGMLSLPEPNEIRRAEQISKELSTLTNFKGNDEIQLVFRKGSKIVELPFPPSAFKLLMQVMEQTALGNSVTIIPNHAELTTQEAANLLNVSRPYLVKLLKDGRIPHRKVGAHRRVLFQDLMNYKKEMLRESTKARALLAKLSEEIEQDD